MPEGINWDYASFSIIITSFSCCSRVINDLLFWCLVPMSKDF